MSGPKVGDKVKLNSVAGETGTIREVIRRGHLEPMYKIKWDDGELGTGILFEHEFEVGG